MSLIKSISGIRGTIGGKPGENLSPLDVVKFASAFGSVILQEAKSKKIVIGRDARPSGPWVSDLISHSLRNLGLNVVDLGLSTTPTVQMAVVAEEAGSEVFPATEGAPLTSSMAGGVATTTALVTEADACWCWWWFRRRVPMLKVALL